MKVSVQKEQLKAVVRQAIISMLEDDVYEAPALRPAQEQSRKPVRHAHNQAAYRQLARAEFNFLFD